MAKRFVPFSGVVLTSGTRGLLEKNVLPQSNGDIVITTGSGYAQVFLCPEQFEQLISLVKLEDVPEPKSPGQLLFEEFNGGGWELMIPEHRRPWEDRAQRLGIQPH